jgi:hypothetical protein
VCGLGKAKFESAKPFERLNLVKNQVLGYETSIIGTKKQTATDTRMAKERLFKINHRRNLNLNFAVLIHAGKGIYLFEGQINHIRDFVQKQIQENLAVKRPG